MSEKLESLFKELKDKHYISLYYNRVMVYNEGFGEIQFWTLSDSGDILCISNKGVDILFDRWEFRPPEEGKPEFLTLYLDNKLVTKLKMPKLSRIIANHNNFYIEEFVKKMISILEENVREKGDWADFNYDDALINIEKNLAKLKNKTSEEEVRKSCIDIANYAAMSYYLFEQAKQEN